MKRFGFGIAILLAGILLELALESLPLIFPWTAAGVGLAFVIAGCCEKEPG